MTKRDKLVDKLKHSANTFAWSDLVTLLSQLGYQKEEKAGSRIRFLNAKTGHMLRMHRPHPENHIKGGALKDLKQQLTQEGYL